jgi:hypothetical protein
MNSLLVIQRHISENIYLDYYVAGHMDIVTFAYFIRMKLWGTTINDIYANGYLSDYVGMTLYEKHLGKWISLSLIILTRLYTKGIYANGYFSDYVDTALCERHLGKWISLSDYIDTALYERHLCKWISILLCRHGSVRMAVKQMDLSLWLYWQSSIRKAVRQKDFPLWLCWHGSVRKTFR